METVRSTDWREVERLAAAAEAASAGGAVGVAVITAGGEPFGFRAERRFVAASTVKIPIMVEIYRQIDRGERSLSDPYVLHHEAKAPGSGILLHLHDGITLTLNDLIYLMISTSDNTATNVLIEMAGMAQVNATMRELGMTDSVLGRPMRGRLALPDEAENWATPRDYARAVQAILSHEAASAGSCEQMLAMLAKQQNPRRLARFLPEGVPWGSKTGSVPGVTNDAGYILGEQGPLIIAVYCEQLADQHTGEQVIGEISRAAMRATGVCEPLLTS